MTTQTDYTADMAIGLYRSDMGDGGWSLHADDARETLLVSGSGRMVRGGWAMPSQRAYRMARAQIARIGRGQRITAINYDIA